MSAEKPLNEMNALLEGLRSQVPVPVRLRSLGELGLSSAQIRRAVAVSPESLRLWAKGTSVRPSNHRVLDDIGRAAAALLEGLGDRTATVIWLTSPVDPDSPAPLDMIREQGEAVLAAAEAHVSGRVEQERDFLAQAAEGGRRGVGSSDATTTDRSSTQLNQLLLARLNEIIANHSSAQEVMRQLDLGYKPELERLPNYQANSSFLEEVREKLKEAGNAPAQQAISDLLTQTSVTEGALRHRFEDLGKRLVDDDGMTILTYALSMRVIQVLWGVPPERQRTCRLYVAEGRVKSMPHSGETSPFADAAEIIRFLGNTGYERSIVPDAVAPTLLEQDRVDLLLLGAQKVYTEGGEPTHFVATAGTNALLRAAKAGGAAIAVVAEESKAVKGEAEQPKAKPRERVVPVRLPSTEEGGGGEHAPLLTISAELCVLDRYETDADRPTVWLVNPAGLVTER